MGDEAGNVASETATVTVVGQNVTLTLSAGGAVGLVAGSVDAGSSDACGVATVSIDVDSFSCASVDASPNAVELSVVDNHGNVATDTYYVTVVDETAPAFVITPT